MSYKDETHLDSSPHLPTVPVANSFTGYWRKMSRRWPLVSRVEHRLSQIGVRSRQLWKSLLTNKIIMSLVQRLTNWRKSPYSGSLALLGGMLFSTLLLVFIDRLILTIPNPGVAYLPLIAMLAYYWGWQLGFVACLLQLLCIYALFLPPKLAFKPLMPQVIAELLVLAAVSIFILLLVQLARNRRNAALREVTRFAALNAIGVAVASEQNENQLLRLIARTACDLTGAGFAAFTLRPVDSLGQPLVPAEGSRFHLAAVVGVTPEQEALFRRIPLGGEGLLAPIFQHGTTVRVDDALELLSNTHHASFAHTVPQNAQPQCQSSQERLDKSGDTDESSRAAARDQALSYARGEIAAKDLRGVGAPRGHPIVRSFLGAPLLDREGRVRGGLLLGHNEPERFTEEDEKLLRALAAQAAVAIENARLYHAAQAQAQELYTVFESIADGVMVYDQEGTLRHENYAATQIHQSLAATKSSNTEDVLALDKLIRQASSSENLTASPNVSDTIAIALPDEDGEEHEYVVNVSPLRSSLPSLPPIQDASPDAVAKEEQATTANEGSDDSVAITHGTVVVWHEVTETHKLLAEQQARARAEAGRSLLQTVLDELPSGVYLVRGIEAKLVLANHAAHSVWGATWREGQSMEAFLAENGIQIVTSGGRPLPLSELATIQTLHTGEAVRHYQEIIHRRDGTTLPVLLNTVALDEHMLADTLLLTYATEPVASAQPVALVVLQDVTAIKDAERLKDEFIAIAAHELKTPMAAVKGYADMLLHQTGDSQAAPLTSWQIEALETIDQATNRLVELTEDLLDVARLQADRLQLHREPHELVALARRMVKRFQMTSGQHTFTLSASDEYVVACLDIRRTEQVVGNLLSNAIKYSPDGGSVVLTVEQDEAAGTAKLAVRDEGIGIPVNQQALLFNRFVRAENARERGIAGTGLGLYLCRELIERQGGRLWFTSEEGRGSTFFLTLPLAQESE